MDDFLAKPLEFEALALMLAEWLPVVVQTELVSDPSSIGKPVDWALLSTLIDELTPLLEKNSFDAMRQFRQLKDLLADTALAREVDQMEPLLKELRFDLVLKHLCRLPVHPATKLAL
jgi:hypothetical protein